MGANNDHRKLIQRIYIQLTKINMKLAKIKMCESCYDKLTRLESQKEKEGWVNPIGAPSAKEALSHEHAIKRETKCIK